MKKGILLILDGYGEGKPYQYNAVTNADTPFLHGLRFRSHALLEASGEDVGLTKGELGGSEVGHTTIGAGRIVPSTFERIEEDIKTGAFDKNKDIVSILKHLESKKANLHLIGMMSDKNIHSNINHLIRIAILAKNSARNIFIHFISDGRDTGPIDSNKYLTVLKNGIKNIANCHIISVSGRFYSMDRESYNDRTLLACDAMFKTDNEILEDEIDKYLTSQHKAGNNDQYIIPRHVHCDEYNGLNSSDVLFFTNFREDRMIQLVEMCKTLNKNIVTMIRVGHIDTKVLYKPQIVKHTLSEYLSDAGLKQIKISETTKYAHVTYFLNGGRIEPFEHEDRIHIKTKKTNDYANTPKMRASGITKAVLKSIKSGYSAIIVNYSNPDMLGHTGNYKATVKALEYLDKCVKKVVETAKEYNYFVLITADHGNSEQMMTKTGEPHMAHTLNPVMCVEATGKCKMKENGGLRDIAPTFLDLMGVGSNKYFEGETLIDHVDKSN